MVTMTIAASLPTWIQLPGNGSGTTFAFPFKIFQATDLIVGFIVSGTYIPQTVGFTVNNIDVNGGGSVTFTVPPPNGTTVDLRTQTPMIQNTEFANLGAFLPESHTEGLDRLTRMAQDLYRLAYTFGIHGPDQENTPWPALPAPTARKSYALMFDASTGLPTIGFLSAQNVTQGLIGPILNPQTAAEIAAGVTPVNYAYPPYNAWRYLTAAQISDVITGGLTQDCTVALSNWLKVVQTVTTGFPTQSFKGGYLPGGVYLTSGTLGRITSSKLRIYGDGSDASRIVVNGGGSSFTVLAIGNARPTTILVGNVKLQGIGIFRNGGSGAVTLLEVTYTQYCQYEDLTLYDNTGTTGGVGLNYAGHENNTFQDLWIVNVQPIILANPSGNNGDGCDHTTFNGLEIQSSNDTQALITCVGANLSLSNIAFLGTQVWLGGIYGFLYNDTGIGATIGVGGNLLFENIRREQTSSSSNNDSIHIRVGGSSGGGSNNFMTNVLLRNCTFGLLSNLAGGVYFEGVQAVTLENFTNSIGGVGVSFIARTGVNQAHLAIINSTFDPAASTLTNMEQVFGSNNLLTTNLGAGAYPQTCIFQYSDGTTAYAAEKGMTIYGGRHWSTSVASVAASGGTVVIPGTNISMSNVTVCADSAGVIDRGDYVCSQGVAVILTSSTTNMANAVTVGKVSLTWNGSNWIVTNDTAVIKRIMVSVEWK